MNRPTARTGFTLIELLTVIAIIGILAAILIPVVGKVRESARTAKCISNVRQVTTAIVLFGDEVGHFPYAASRGIDPRNPLDFIYWRDERQARLVDSPIAPYVGGALERELLVCPDDDASAERTYFPSYTMNGYVAGNSSRMSYGSDGIDGRFEKLRDPSRVIILVDEEAPDDGHFGNANDVTTRHNGQGTLGFADGHVALMTNEDARDQELFNPFGEPRPRGR